MEVSMESIARNIKAERMRKGMTREDLAKASGVSESALGTYERAMVKIPFVSAIAVADALDVSIDAIAGR